METLLKIRKLGNKLVKCVYDEEGEGLCKNVTEIRPSIMIERNTNIQSKFWDKTHPAFICFKLIIHLLQ